MIDSSNFRLPTTGLTFEVPLSTIENTRTPKREEDIPLPNVILKAQTIKQ